MSWGIPILPMKSAAYRFTALILTLSLLCPPVSLYADDKLPEPEYTQPVKHKRKRNYFFPALGTFFIPGLDQFINKQPLTGAAFATLGVAGLGVSYLSSRTITTGSTDLDSKDNKARFSMLGYEMYSVAGGLSMYHSFRDAVDTRKEDFPFLGERDKDLDLVLSPFRMDYMLRPTTFVPLLVQAGLVGLLVKEGHNEWQGLTLADGFFATTFSVGAGTWEESAFRGWMMPVFRKWVGYDFLSNAMAATVFAAGHYSAQNKLPIYQLITGWYLGYVTQRNDWSISESIFIHTWIDIIAFTTAFAFGKDKEAKIQLSPIVLRF